MINILLSLLMIWIGRTSADLPSTSWIRNYDQSGKLYDNPMFEITARGRIHCTVRCSMESCCQTMTYNPNTNGCRGYCRNTTIEEELSSDAGRELYLRGDTSADHMCGYDKNTSLCYSLKTDDQDKHGAAAQCERDNGHLFRVESFERLLAVEGVLRDYFNNSLAYVWVDGEDYNSTNNYVMANGNSVPLTDAFWSSGEPNGLEYEQCVGIHYGYKLNDWPCVIRHKYLCEY
ncbi:uncharacterized protein LOC117343559 [Pecten maximus]|uniref:uncharacterized protein LOC117343559 n=1 Tax=Pecten maximus TaxID=6579 RepID=UPI00145842B5|nr:uncharacterized protein LOC117343559 [Pecten maximus]